MHSLHLISLYCECNEGKHSAGEQTDDRDYYRKDVFDQVLCDVTTHPDVAERSTDTVVVEIELPRTYDRF